MRATLLCLLALSGCIIGPDGRRHLDPEFARAMSEGSRRSQEDFQRMNEQTMQRQRESNERYQRQQEAIENQRRFRETLQNGTWQPDPWKGGFRFVPNTY